MAKATHEESPPDNSFWAYIKGSLQWAQFARDFGLASDEVTPFCVIFAPGWMVAKRYECFAVEYLMLIPPEIIGSPEWPERTKAMYESICRVRIFRFAQRVEINTLGPIDPINPDRPFIERRIRPLCAPALILMHTPPEQLVKEAKAFAPALELLLPPAYLKLRVRPGRPAKISSKEELKAHLDEARAVVGEPPSEEMVAEYLNCNVRTLRRWCRRFEFDWPRWHDGRG